MEHAALEAREIDGLIYWAPAWGPPGRMPAATFVGP